MPRPQRVDEAGVLYHASNRDNGWLQIFWKLKDDSAFERIMAEGTLLTPMTLLEFANRPGIMSDARRLQFFLVL